MSRLLTDLNDTRFAIVTESLARRWWAVALRGVAAIVFGILAFVMPGVTLAALILLFGAYALVDGVLDVVAAVSGRTGARSWWALLLAGLVSIAAGLVTFFWPELTAIALVYVIAAWAIVRGVFEIAAAVRLRTVIASEWWLGLSGALSIDASSWLSACGCAACGMRHLRACATPPEARGQTVRQRTYEARREGADA